MPSLHHVFPPSPPPTTIPFGSLSAFLSFRFNFGFDRDVETESKGSRGVRHVATDVAVRRMSGDAHQSRRFWTAKFTSEACQYWDRFYLRHGDRFFKDRHYLHVEFPHLAGSRRHLEVGCGVGNAAFPLAEAFEEMHVTCCDFSEKAVETLRARMEYDPSRMDAFVCDVAKEELVPHLHGKKVDSATLIFVLSAMHPDAMKETLEHLGQAMKIGGRVYVRDYAAEDLTHQRFGNKSSRGIRKLQENFYVRGDGTCVYYFTPKTLLQLFETSGFRAAEPVRVHARQILNRKEDVAMDRRWIQAEFEFTGDPCIPCNWESANEEEEAVFRHMEDLVLEPGPEVAKTLERIQERDEFLLGSVESYPMNEFGVKLSIKQAVYESEGSGLAVSVPARVFCAFMRRNPLPFAGRNACELGGGCGLCALVAVAVACCQSVTCTDCSRPVLANMESNTASNLGKEGHLQELGPSVVEHALVRWQYLEDVHDLLSKQRKRYDLVYSTGDFADSNILKDFFRTAERLLATDGRSVVMVAFTKREEKQAQLLEAALAVGLVPTPVTVGEHNAWIAACHEHGNDTVALSKFRRG